jgi:hypothetical protein
MNRTSKMHDGKISDALMSTVEMQKDLDALRHLYHLVNHDTAIRSHPNRDSLLELMEAEGRELRDSIEYNVNAMLNSLL